MEAKVDKQKLQKQQMTQAKHIMKILEKKYGFQKNLYKINNNETKNDDTKDDDYKLYKTNSDFDWINENINDDTKIIKQNDTNNENNFDQQQLFTKIKEIYNINITLNENKTYITVKNICNDVEITCELKNKELIINFSNEFDVETGFNKLCFCFLFYILFFHFYIAFLYIL